MPADPATPGFSRRVLLRGGLASLALLAFAGGALTLQRSKLRAAPAAGLRVLTLAEYSILAAIAARFVPAASGSGPDAVPGSSGIDVALLADRMLEGATPDVVEGLRLALGLVESGLTGALFGERLRPFTQLSPVEQDQALLAFHQSGVALRRTVYQSFSALSGSLYYGDPAAWPSVGYPGPPDPQALRTSYTAQLVDYEALRPKSG